MKYKNIYAVLLLMTVLPLAACQTTAQKNSYSTDSGKIDTVLARATEDAAHSGNTSESLALFERIYKRDSSNPENALKYATALREAERLNRAEMILQPFAAKKNDGAILSEYAAIQSAMGNYDIAEEYARKAVLLSPTSGQAYHILGIALDAQGHHPQAEVAFRKALDNWKGDPASLLNNLGLNLAAQGFIDESLDTLRKAAALAPERKEIERNIRIVSALQIQPSKQRPAPVRVPDPEPEMAEPAAGENVGAVKSKEAEMTANTKPVKMPFYRD